MSEHFDKFMEGWTTGNLEVLLSACAEDFVFDDAIDGRFTKAEFPAYFDSLGQGVVKITNVVTEELLGLETAWCWWSLESPVGATLVSQEGAALAMVGRDGVHSQKVTYFAREPNIAPR